MFFFANQISTMCQRMVLHHACSSKDSKITHTHTHVHFDRCQPLLGTEVHEAPSAVRKVSFRACGRAAEASSRHTAAPRFSLVSVFPPLEKPHRQMTEAR